MADFDVTLGSKGNLNVEFDKLSQDLTLKIERYKTNLETSTMLVTTL